MIADNYVPVKTLGNGTTVNFSLSFAILASGNERVYLEDKDTGVQTLQTLGSDYTLAFDDDGGIITFLTPPTSQYYVVIGRDIPKTQEVPLTTSPGFQAEVVEGAFDKLTCQVQDLQEQVNRSIKVDIGSELPDDYLGDAQVAAAVAEVARIAAETAQSAAETAQSAAETAQSAAEAAASGVNLPSILSGDTKKVLQVNADETGYELTSGNAANRPVILNSDGKLPAIDGSQLTNVPTPAYIKVSDVKTQNSPGGTFDSGAWKTRIINTEDNDTGNHCSISSNQITLDAGTYECYISCPACYVDNHQARLYNISDSVVTLLGQNANALGAYNVSNCSIIIGRFTIVTQKTFEIQHYCIVGQGTTGFGIALNIGSEIYTIAEFRKVA